MLDTIEKLLILQDRDRRIRRLQGELAHIEPERHSLKAKAAAAQTALEAGKTRAKETESKRKELELEVEAKKELISKYANQQFQTRKNEEYRALAHEIELCKQAIFKIEDQEIALMEQAEAAQKEVARATQTLADSKKLVEEQLAALNAREGNLKKELAELSANRQELASAVDDMARARYERLVKNKGENVVVGIQHGVCGGCHLRGAPQPLVTCPGEQEAGTCSKCGRVLFYTPDMGFGAAGEGPA